MATSPTPGVPKELVEWLERVFPNRVPTLTMTNRSVWAAVGQQDVIAKLRSIYNAQVNKELERK